jgi:ribose transport system substrate-binding protein
VGVGLVLLTVAGCGSSSYTSTGSAGPTATGSTTSSASTTGANSAIAQQILASYLGRASAFPVTTPLQRRPVGATVDFINCGNPSCTLFYSSLQAAGREMGVNIKSIATDVTAQGAQTALSTALQQRPAAVIVPAYPVEAIATSLKALKAAGIPVVGFGSVGGAPDGMAVSVNGQATWTLIGKLEAAYAYTLHGAKANVLYVSAPEIAITPTAIASFDSEMKQLCASCSVSQLSVPAASIGTTAPKAIVSALQAHPAVNEVIAPDSEIFNGLPSALRVAGITVDSFGAAGNSTNLEDLKAGQQTADIQIDFPVTAWMALDAAARLITKQKLTPDVVSGAEDLEILRTGDHFTFNQAIGWTAYPDYAQRFAKLWGVTK